MSTTRTAPLLVGLVLRRSSGVSPGTVRKWTATAMGSPANQYGDRLGSARLCPNRPAYRFAYLEPQAGRRGQPGLPARSWGRRFQGQPGHSPPGKSHLVIPGSCRSGSGLLRSAVIEPPILGCGLAGIARSNSHPEHEASAHDRPSPNDIKLGMSRTASPGEHKRMRNT